MLIKDGISLFTARWCKGCIKFWWDHARLLPSQSLAIEDCHFACESQVPSTSKLEEILTFVPLQRYASKYISLQNLNFTYIHHKRHAKYLENTLNILQFTLYPLDSTLICQNLHFNLHRREVVFHKSKGLSIGSDYQEALSAKFDIPIKLSAFQPKT